MEHPLSREAEEINILRPRKIEHLLGMDREAGFCFAAIQLTLYAHMGGKAAERGHGAVTLSSYS